VPARYWCVAHGAVRAEDLALVRRDPGERRRYLDDLATFVGRGSPGVRADYDKVLRQRTALLKSGTRLKVSAATGCPGDLGRLGRSPAPRKPELMAARLELVGALARRLEKAYQLLAPSSRPATINIAAVWTSGRGSHATDSVQTLEAAVVGCRWPRRAKPKSNAVYAWSDQHRDDLGAVAR